MRQLNLNRLELTSLTRSRNGQFGEELFTLRGTYLEGRPPKSVNMHWRKFFIADIPLHDEKAFEEWLHQRWKEKDELLEHYQQTGRFPADEGKDPWNGAVSPHKVAFGAGHIETEVRPVRAVLEVAQIFLPSAMVIFGTIGYVLVSRYFL